MVVWVGVGVGSGVGVGVDPEVVVDILDGVGLLFILLTVLERLSAQVS